MTLSKYTLNKISYSDRVKLEEYLDHGLSSREIEKKGLMSKTSVFREIKRCKSAYNASEAQKDAEKKHTKKVSTSKKYRNETNKRIDDLERRISELETLLIKN